MKTYIQNFGKLQEWPAEAIETMTAAYEKLEKHGEAGTFLQKWIQTYEQDIHMDYEAALADMKKAAALTGLSRYTTELLLFVCLSRHTKTLYEAQGISMEIYRDSMLDLKWKLLECRKVHGVWGSFVAFWFPGFFDLTRFAIGRLQFEKIPFPESYRRQHPQESFPDQAVNVHIPSCGPLTEADCDAAFAGAAAFFAADFPEGKIPFVCFSWLLFEGHKEMLPETSNIRRFASRFTLFGSREENGDLWRVFDTEQIGNPEKLPENSGLQRAYKKWLLEGKMAGNADGIFWYEPKGGETGTEIPGQIKSLFRTN